MRIALVTHKADFQDGQGRVNYEIAQAALQAGHEVTIIGEYCSDDLAHHPRARFAQMRKHHLPTQLLRTLYFAFKSARWIRKHRSEFDLIQANGFITWEPADIVAVHFVHSTWLRSPHYPFHWKSFSPYAWYQRCFTLINSQLERGTFSQARKLIAVSRATADAVRQLPIPQKPIQVIYSGVDVNEFHPLQESESVAALRQSFGLPTDVPLALFVGDIRTPRKNLGTVLAALRNVPQAHLAVAGDAQGSPYPEQAKELGIADRVHFLGKSSRIPALMRAVDLFVFPSRYETWGLVVLEAMASGLPVILSASVGASEFVSDVCHVLDRHDDPVELANAMQQILSLPETRAVMAKAGRERALEVRWTRTANEYLSVYEKYVAGLS